MPEMGRRPSGGLRVGTHLIEFGDFGEPVDLELARERADSVWLDPGRAEEESFHGERLEGLGIKEFRR